MDGLTFAATNTPLIGGHTNTEPGRIDSVGVTRDSANRLIGFSGTASPYRGLASIIGGFNDGGVVFGPSGVLFTLHWPVNQRGQTKPGSIDEDQIIDMAALGIAQPHGALNFVPAGRCVADKLKLVSWGWGEWCNRTLTSDGLGPCGLAGRRHLRQWVEPGGLASTACHFPSVVPAQ